MHMKLVVNARELALALGLEVATIHQYASKRPDMLPPRLTLPTRKLLWAVKDVEEWVEAYRKPRPVEDQSSSP